MEPRGGSGGGGQPPASVNATNTAAGGRALDEDLRITGANLLADLDSLPPPRMTPRLVSVRILPVVLGLCSDASSFRVRRAAVQALPRLLAASSEADAAGRVLPAFER